MIRTQALLTSATALIIVQAAIAHAMTRHWLICATVVDPWGVPLALQRMDSVAPPVVEFALDKAYTAATLKRSTKAFFEQLELEPATRLGLVNRTRLLVWGGGLPIFHAGQIVGAVGVSGVKDFQDIECAEVAVKAAGLDWSA